MNHDQKIEFHKQVAEIENAVVAMNGPYSATCKIVKMLSALREDWLEDAVFCGCESCDDTIFESEMDAAFMSEDAGWFCSECVKTWNDDTANPRRLT